MHQLVEITLENGASEKVADRAHDLLGSALIFFFGQSVVLVGLMSLDNLIKLFVVSSEFFILVHELLARLVCLVFFISISVLGVHRNLFVLTSLTLTAAARFLLFGTLSDQAEHRGLLEDIYQSLDMGACTLLVIFI